ncbi:putative phospholipid ABC transporter-binding protein MlaD [compost metagenome]
MRAPVKSAGVVVGRVAGISFDDKTYQAIVSVNLETAYQFPKDSSAAILTSGLLGEQYLGLTAGSEEDNFTDGGKIRYTQSAVVLEQLISQFLYGSAEKQGTNAAPEPAAKAPD